MRHSPYKTQNWTSEQFYAHMEKEKSSAMLREIEELIYKYNNDAQKPRPLILCYAMETKAGEVLKYHTNMPKDMADTMLGDIQEIMKQQP